MERRNFLGIALAASALSSLAAQWKRPNILWIITDDHRPDSWVCYNEAVRDSKLSPLGVM